MLFTDNLEELIFTRHDNLELDCDELIIISGYLGPAPVQRLSELPFPTRVIYGMYSNSISERLHNIFLNIDVTHKDVHILYSKTPIHSKCYIWRKEEVIQHALIGSANFSRNGLTTPFRETLAEVDENIYIELNEYLHLVISNSINCSSVTLETKPTLSSIISRSITSNSVHTAQSNVCDIDLYDPRTKEVQPKSALNWGHGSANTNIDDAYIRVGVNHVRVCPSLFPPKQNIPTITSGGRSQRHNDSIEMIWDDGEIMEGLLEGTQRIDGIDYPKQLSSFPQKNILGSYIRGRLNLSSGSEIKKIHLDSYGRDYISITLLSNGTYYMDFSIKS